MNTQSFDQTGQMIELCYWVLICTVHLTVCFCHVTYVFQSESTLYSCLNVKELLPRSRREIWSLSDCSWTWVNNHLIHKRTLNHLAKLASLAQWLSVSLWYKWLWVRVLLQSLVFFVCFLLLLSQQLIYFDWTENISRQPLFGES